MDEMERLNNFTDMLETSERNRQLPLVTIITPAHNRASFLKETIQSVLAQDYPCIEYIVLDDGSTDNTREVLEKYSGTICWESHSNIGETRTANKGFGKAKGEIVCVVNSDDPLLPGAVITAVEFLQSHSDILVAYPDWIRIGPDSEVIEYVQVPEYDYLYMLRYHHCIVGPGAFIRRKAFELAGVRDPNFRYVADFEYWLRLGLYGPFARIPKTLATFRVHPVSASVCHKGAVMAYEHIRLIKKFYSLPDLPQEIRKVRSEAFSSAHYVAAEMCGPERKAACKHYFKSILYHPAIFLNEYKMKLTLSEMLPRQLFKTLRLVWCMMHPVLRFSRRALRSVVVRGHRFFKLNL
jgi:glycosyltransferase involved in cell wall biosynthesis